MKNPFVGQLDRVIQIIAQISTQNTMGEQKPSDSVVAQPWAYMIESGGEEDVDGKIRHLIDRKYIIRYNSDVLTNGHKYIVRDNSVDYEVYHVMELGRRKHLQLLVKKSE